MSKVSTTSTPEFMGSRINIGGASAYSGLQNGQQTSNYQMSPSDFQIYNYALSTIANLLPNVNTFDSNTLADIENSVNAYKNQGIKEINTYYDKSLNNIKNDLVSRFGNLDNSMFGQNLNELEESRSNSVSNFAQNVLARQNELMSDELNRRYSLINLLNGLSNNIYTKALNTISTAMNGSSNLNNFNNNLYNASLTNNRYVSQQIDPTLISKLLSVATL